MNVENDFLIWHRGELTSSGMFHQILYCLSSLAFFMHIVPLVALCCEILNVCLIFTYCHFPGTVWDCFLFLEDTPSPYTSTFWHSMWQFSYNSYFCDFIITLTGPASPLLKKSTTE